MLLEIRDGTVSLKGEVILSQLQFEIKGTEKLAIVGRNGAGKTTLLEVIAGERDLDRDEKNPQAGLYRSRQFRVGMLRQQAVTDPEKTVEETILDLAGVKPIDASSSQEVLQAEGTAKNHDDSGNLPAVQVAEVYSKERYEFEQRFNRMFTELGLPLSDKKKKLGDFSGGEQTKIMLIGLLLSEPEVLILDEPTNHLDVSTCEWLEDQVRRYPKAVVMVSHDRYFIDHTVDVVWEVSRGKAHRYPGNYTHYREQKAAAAAKQRKAYEAQQKEIERLDALIEKFKHKPRKAAFAKSREKILERMERIDAPERDDAVIHTGDILPARAGSKNVLECKDLQIGYDKPARIFSARIRRGQKIGIFGPNGTGKSTFLRTVVSQVRPLKGTIRVGENVDIAYFDQMTANITSEQNIFDWFHDQFPAMRGEDVRSYLAGFLFRGNDLGKKVRVLSGGEKARLVLAKLLQTQPNFLVLDEPTNNMDIPAMETLESILRDYKGTILFVSHDRYFLSRVADALYIFEPDTTQVQYYPFGYEHYAERKRRVEAGEDADLARSAEEQRLIEGLRSVPKRDKRERELTTGEAQVDWEFSLNRRVREEAKTTFALMDERAAAEAEYIPETEEEYWAMQDAREKDREKAEEARDDWTKACLDWYDIFLESEEGRS